MCVRMRVRVRVLLWGWYANLLHTTRVTRGCKFSGARGPTRRKHGPSGLMHCRHCRAESGLEEAEAAAEAVQQWAALTAVEKAEYEVRRGGAGGAAAYGIRGFAHRADRMCLHVYMSRDNAYKSMTANCVLS